MPCEVTPNNDLLLHRVGFPVVDIPTARHKAHRVGGGSLEEAPGEVGTGLGSVAEHHMVRHMIAGLEEVPGDILDRCHIG